MTQLTVRMGSQPEAAGRIDDLGAFSAVGVKLLDLFLYVVASKQRRPKLIFVPPGPAQDFVFMTNRHQM